MRSKSEKSVVVPDQWVHDTRIHPRVSSDHHYSHTLETDEYSEEAAAVAAAADDDLLLLLLLLLL